MRIKDIVFGLIACSAFSFVSCSDDEFTEVQSSLTVTSAETSIEATGGTKQIHVEGSFVSVYTSAPWLTVSYEGSVISVTASLNEDSQSRNAIVVVKASSTDSTLVNVSQFGAQLNIDAPETSYIGSIAAEFEYGLESNLKGLLPINVVASDEWITTNIVDDKLLVSIADTEMEDEYIREGYVEITSGNLIKRIEFVQYNMLGEYELSGTDTKGVSLTLPGHIEAGNTNDILYFCPSVYAGVRIPIEFSIADQTLSLAAGSSCERYGTKYVYTNLLDIDTKVKDGDEELIGSRTISPSVYLAGKITVIDNKSISCEFADMGNGHWEQTQSLTCGHDVDVTYTATTLRLAMGVRQGINLARETLVDIVNPVLTKVTVSNSKELSE